MEQVANLSDALAILKNKKAACEYCHRIEAAIAQLAPLVTNGHTPSHQSKASSPHRPTLISGVISVLEKREAPLTTAEILKALPETGYETRAKTLRSVLYPVLSRNQAKGILIKVGDRWGLGQWGTEGKLSK